MKLYLVYVPNVESKDVEDYFFPNGLLYLYANVSENIDAELVFLYPEYVEDFVNELNSGDIVGFSINTSNKKYAFSVAEYIKNSVKNVKVIAGGPFISLINDKLLNKIEFIDSFFKYEGEITLKKYIEGKIDGKIINGSRISDLNSLKFPALSEAVYSNIITTRGCPGACIYCSSPKLWERKITLRSAENVFEEIKILYDKGVDYFVFADDTFTISKRRVSDICSYIINSNMKIIFDVRTRIDYTSEDILEALSAAGCVSISFGIESASMKILKILKKRQNLKRARKIIEKCADLGISTNLFFIVGNPGETGEDMTYNEEFIKEVKPDWITVYGLHYYPGTELLEKYPKNIDWLDIEKTVYYDSLSDIEKKRKRLYSVYRNSLKRKKIIIPKKETFIKYLKQASLAKHKNKKIEYLKKSLNFYESPEVMFELVVNGEKKYLKKAREKFVFQYENDIRKSENFFINLLSFFDYISDTEMFERVYYEYLTIFKRTPDI